MSLIFLLNKINYFKISFSFVKKNKILAGIPLQTLVDYKKNESKKKSTSIEKLEVIEFVTKLMGYIAFFLLKRVRWYYCSV